MACAAYMPDVQSPSLGNALVQVSPSDAPAAQQALVAAASWHRVLQVSQLQCAL